MKLTLPDCPSVNTYYRNVNGRTLISAKGRMYKNLVHGLALVTLRRFTPLDGPVKISIVYSPNGRKAKDIDNLNKVIFDSLEGIAYHNDRQVVELHSIKSTPVKGGAVTVSWEAV